MKTPKINISKLLKQIDGFGVDAERLAVAITNSTAESIVSDAKQRVVVDLGQLRQSIGNTNASVGNNRSLVFANAPYAAYVEFGTGGEVSIPKGFNEIAIKFKGKGVKKINLRPRPFLIPAYLIGAAAYAPKLVKALERESKKYNAKK
jgi:HK97 gp10 family phage protein